jgi:hypothetical protein
VEKVALRSTSPQREKIGHESKKGTQNRNIRDPSGTVSRVRLDEVNLQPFVPEQFRQLQRLRRHAS